MNVNDILIYEEVDLNGKPIRVYEHNGAVHSATYLDQDKYELIFDYVKKFNLCFEINLDVKDFLMLGGAGLSYPKYLISHHLDCCIDVIDNDERIIDISKKYFFLDDLIKDYDLTNKKRLNIYIEDAYDYLINNKRIYDVIINDIFDSIYPNFDLLNIECFQLYKDTLNQNGILIFNMPGLDDLNKNPFILNMLYTLKQVFKNVSIVKAFYEISEDAGNYVIIASDKDFKLKDSINYYLSNNRLLTKKSSKKSFKEFMKILKD